MFSAQCISIEGHAIKLNRNIRNLRVETEISNGIKKSNFACLSAVGQKDKFEFIHKQKAVERARIFTGSKSRETKRGFGFKSCLHGHRLPGWHLDLSITERVQTHL